MPDRLPGSALRLLTAILIFHRTGRRPTMSSLCRFLGLSSKNALRKSLKRLEEAGLIEREHFRACAIRPLCYIRMENPLDTGAGSV